MQNYLWSFSPEREKFMKNINGFDYNLSIGIKVMSNKERIEQLEASVGVLQDSFSRLELGVADKLNQMEDTLKRLIETLLANQEDYSSNTPVRAGPT